MTEKIIQEDLLLGEEYTEITRAHKQFLFYMASARVRGIGLVRLLYGEKLDADRRKMLVEEFEFYGNMIGLDSLSCFGLRFADFVKKYKEL